MFLPAGILATERRELPKLYIFHSLNCRNCIEVKQEVLLQMEAEFKGKIVFEYRDVGQMENYKLLLGLLRQDGRGLTFQVPLFYLGNQFLTAKGKVKDNLYRFILQGLKSKLPGVLASSVAVDVDTVNPGSPRIRSENTCEQSHRCCLSGPIGTKETEDLSLAYRDGYIV